MQYPASMAQSNKTWAQPPPQWAPPVQQGAQPAQQWTQQPVQHGAPPAQQWAPPAQRAVSVNNGSPAGRVWFWVSAGLAWAVLALAVTAAAHDEWIVASGSAFSGSLGPGDTDLLRSCDDVSGWSPVSTLCDLYLGFTVTQFIATVMCSIAVGLLTLAAFRPAVAGCAAVKPFGIAAGCLMIVYIVVQIVAVILASLVVEEYDYLVNDVAGYSTSFGATYEFELGLTCWLGVVGIALALFTSVCLLVSVKHAGDGPFACACCQDGGSVKHAHAVHA